MMRKEQELFCHTSIKDVGGYLEMNQDNEVTLVLQWR